MKQRTIIVFTMFFMIFLVSCTANKYEKVNLPETFKWQQLILNEDNEYTFNIESLFKYEGIKISKYDIYKYEDQNDILSINKNKIKPLENGMTELYINIYDNKNKKQYYGLLAKVISIVPSKMIEVKSYEDLKLMNLNKEGKYILKNDIDLKGIDYLPIASDIEDEPFSGMFVNLDGYKIKNLTIKSANNLNHGPNGGTSAALFGRVRNSFLYGLELEDINIDVRDFEGEGFSKASAIATSFHKSISINNHATGTVNGQNYTGGLFGTADYSLVYNNSFKGSISGFVKDKSTLSKIGGISAWSGLSYIENSNFNGEIFQNDNGDVGAITGYHMGLATYLKNNLFHAYNNSQLLENVFGEINAYYEHDWNVEVIVKI